MQTNGFSEDSVEIFLEQVRLGELDIVKAFVGQDADILTVMNENGNSALHYAVANSYKELLEYLLSFPQMKPLINVKNLSGSTPLHWAVRSTPEIVDMLLKNGADKSVLNTQLKTPLELALEEDNEDIVALLIGELPSDVDLDTQADDGSDAFVVEQFDDEKDAKVEKVEQKDIKETREKTETDQSTSETKISFADAGEKLSPDQSKQ
ncbi:ankyrin repeat-containing protein, putative [Entamoeba invadens IP1]|uniref:ankyrin repeat-containing protein, putative n=1 Tax=Entamoeba invadens IP1 TaxID=370355 RepID=UPI0002C3CF2B|nr:ankyrin repeat-containing protein, putative [Entamoeba invadens IP1]ELP93213.1 ankyrin repeat-containing protein, putative [Entamoeba invadens IP1]|eukprot:XP_004259984.1 ankyrin repeat-containing protein, putative [Entamoeba invadens IP1]